MINLLVLNGDYYTGHNTDLNVLTFEQDRKKAQIMSKEAVKNVLHVIMSWIAEDTIELKRLEILTLSNKKEVDMFLLLKKRKIKMIVEYE